MEENKIGSNMVVKLSHEVVLLLWCVLPRVPINGKEHSFYELFVDIGQPWDQEHVEQLWLAGFVLGNTS